MEYNKIVSSKTFELKKDLGLIIEVTEGKQFNTLSFWLQYKDDSGNWAHKSTKGANAVRIPMIDGLASFINDNLKASFDANEKHIPTSQPGKIDVKSLDSETIAAMLKQLGIAIPDTTPKKAKAKKEETTDAIDFASLLLALQAAQPKSKKTKK